MWVSRYLSSLLNILIIKNFAKMEVMKLLDLMMTKLKWSVYLLCRVAYSVLLCPGLRPNYTTPPG